jgi:hypothetical protein
MTAAYLGQAVGEELDTTPVEWDVTYLGTAMKLPRQGRQGRSVVL